MPKHKLIIKPSAENLEKSNNFFVEPTFLH